MVTGSIRADVKIPEKHFACLKVLCTFPDPLWWVEDSYLKCLAFLGATPSKQRTAFGILFNSKTLFFLCSNMYWNKHIFILGFSKLIGESFVLRKSRHLQLFMTISLVCRPYKTEGRRRIPFWFMQIEMLWIMN